MVRLVNLQEAMETANLHVFLVEHNEFKSILRNKKLTEDVCVDAIGLYNTHPKVKLFSKSVMRCPGSANC